MAHISLARSTRLWVAGYQDYGQGFRRLGFRGLGFRHESVGSSQCTLNLKPWAAWWRLVSEVAVRVQASFWRSGP